MNSVKDFFEKNIGYIMVAVMSLAFVATAFVEMGETGKSIGRIIADGAVMFFFGIFINRTLDLQGMMNGDRDDRVIKTLRLHGETVERISPYIDKLDEWCEERNREALRVQRTKILATEGMKYSDFFDEEGTALPFSPDHEKLKNQHTRAAELRRIRCYKKALHLKLTPLTAGELTSEGGKAGDPYYLGRTKAQYERSVSIGDVVSKIALALLFGYYGVELVTDFDYSLLIWQCLQIVMMLIAGVIKMYQAYIFMVDEYRSRVIKKIDNMQKFEIYIKSLEGESEDGKQL